ncbi:baculoviral IAP repeat containing deterin [Leptinotarsa decemlineata]|uniref:baculoviral IAP repeat containing deterin n=1 Tax=Leptinotarsa decemlineata TaxID=7539 RepID=UPI000C255969|nr:baculoviral IAP repeat-containing protein 5 [Leptinotarsa decemlineata]
MSELKEEIQRAMQYILEENRRKTFKKWIFGSSEKCNADKMAEAGFIFTGNKQEPDAVKCFLCNKALDGWESTDDPWKEHLKHAPNCKFAKLQKPQDLTTLEYFLTLKQDLMCTVVNSHMDILKDEIEKEAAELKAFGRNIANRK